MNPPPPPLPKNTLSRLILPQLMKKIIKGKGLTLILCLGFLFAACDNSEESQSPIKADPKNDLVSILVIFNGANTVRIRKLVLTGIPQFVKTKVQEERLHKSS